MPQNTVFHIRDLRPEAGFLLTHEDVQKECGMAAYNTFMERLAQLQKPRRDAETFTRPLETYVHVHFMRMRPKGATVVDLALLFPVLSNCKMAYTAVCSGALPCMSYAAGHGCFCHFLLWAGVVGPEKVERTGYAEVSDLYDEFPLTRVTAAMRKRAGLKDLGPLPVFSNSGRETITLTHGSGRAAIGPAIVGIAFSVKKVCNNCIKVGTFEEEFDEATFADARGFKMCSRCKDSFAVPVWYCSKACQTAHYAIHRPFCKASAEFFSSRMRLLDPSIKDEPWAGCQSCHVKPTTENVRSFVQCLDCNGPGHPPTVYCGNFCRAEHFTVHRELCLERQLVQESKKFLRAFTDELSMAKEDFPHVFKPEECDALSEELEGIMAGLDSDGGLSKRLASPKI